MSKTLTYGSLCAGVGGFDLGFDAAGMECAWQVEIDPKCRQVLARHWPGAERFDDMTKVSKNELRTVDVICGGTPCQAFSVAGKRGSLSDARGNLAFEFVRVCDELGPRLIVWENVPGVLSTRDNAFGCLLAALVGADAPLVPPRQCGGRWSNAGLVTGPRRSAGWIVKDARHFGVPQRRRRVFVVASASAESVAEILFKPEGVSGDTATGEGAGEVAPGEVGSGAEAVGRPGRTGGGLDAGGGGRAGVEDGGVVTATFFPTVGTLAASGAGLSRAAGQGNELDFLVPTLSVNNDSRVGLSEVAAPQRGGQRGQATVMTPTVETAAPRVARQGKGGFIDPVNDNIIAFEPAAYGISNQPTPKFGEDVMPSLDSKQDGGGRLECVAFQQNTRDEVRLIAGDGDTAGALTAQPGMKQQNYIATPARMTARRLTPVECERLQGFPDGHTEGGAGEGGNAVAMSDSTRYKQCGNAVCAAVSEWWGKRIVAHRAAWEGGAK